MPLLLTPREELLWLVALIDGEGCFTVNGKYPNIVLHMTDEDTVRLAHKRAGCGHITGPHKPKLSHHKPFWTWKVSYRPHVFALCRSLLPYMSERRSEVISSLLKTDKKTDEPIWVRLEKWN